MKCVGPPESPSLVGFHHLLLFCVLTDPSVIEIENSSYVYCIRPDKSNASNDMSDLTCLLKSDISWNVVDLIGHFPQILYFLPHPLFSNVHLNENNHFSERIEYSIES